MSSVVNHWKQLADILISTDELDPVYTFAVKLKRQEGEGFLKRFLMCFFTFYDLGDSLRVAEQTSDDNFWGVINFDYDKLKRGKERRHSRGDLGRKYIANLSAHGTPNQIWDRLYRPDYDWLVENVESNFAGCGIGPYFTWKLMDFYDRIIGMPVTLTHDEARKWLPDEPRKAIKLGWPNETNFMNPLLEIADYISEYPAPGLLTRNCGISEAETILCAIKGLHFARSYNIGDDLRRRHAELADFGQYRSLLSPLLDAEYVGGDFVAT